MTDNIHTHTFYAMGCHMAVWLEHEDAQTAVHAFSQVVSIFADAEKQMSRFSTDSELSRLNARAGQWVQLSPDLWAVVHQAVQMADETGGLFDPTMLNALEAAGYKQSFATMTAQTAVYTQPHQENGRFQEIEFDDSNRAIKLPHGVRLDLGGIGKGYTAEQAIAYLNMLGPCLVDAGGDLVAGDAPRLHPGWPVGIAAPWSDDGERENLLRLWLSHGALATSGVDYRQWQQNGRLQHHIIDPRNGRAADTDLLTVSVLADNACTAETWATAALVAGLEDGRDWMTTHTMAAAFINQDGDIALTPALAPQVQWEWAVEMV